MDFPLAKIATIETRTMRWKGHRVHGVETDESRLPEAIRLRHFRPNRGYAVRLTLLACHEPRDSDCGLLIEECEEGEAGNSALVMTAYSWHELLYRCLDHFADSCRELPNEWEDLPLVLALFASVGVFFKPFIIDEIKDAIVIEDKAEKLTRFNAIIDSSPDAKARLALEEALEEALS